MPPVAHQYRLGKNNTFTFGNMIANKDVKSVTITYETSAEAEVTTRGSDNVQEFVPVRQNVQIEVVVLDHSCSMHATGVLATTPPTGPASTGPFYVNNVSEPQEIDGVMEWTITLKRHVGV